MSKSRSPVTVLEEVRQRRRAQFQQDLSDPRHGTPNGYRNLKCRCGPCRLANTQSHQEWMNDPEHPERKVKHRESVAAARARSRLRHPSNIIALNE